MATKQTTNYSAAFGDKFQAHVLAVMCMVPGFCQRYRTALDHTYFENKTHRAIARGLLGVVDTDHQLPSLATLVEYVRPLVGDDEMSAVETALERISQTNVSDVQSVMGKVVEFGKQQALVNAVLEAAEKLDKGNQNIKAGIETALTVGEDLLDIGTDYIEEVEARAKSYTEPDLEAIGIRTGITHLDLVLPGGLGRGELGVVLAPPGRGKTTTLVNIGFGALCDVGALNVAHYSLEMNRKRIVRRYDDRLMGARVKYKRSDPHRYADELVGRVRQLPGRIFVHSYNTRSAGVSALRAHLWLLQSRGFRPDVVIVDYADIMRAERRIGEMRHEQASVYEDLRSLAGEFDAAVWTASQATKGSLEKEVITIADFAESFEKAAICDVALGFCQTDDEKIDQRARLFAAKIRNAEDSRTIECEVRRHQCLIRSIGVLDAAGTRIMGPTDESVELKTTVHHAGTKTTVTKLKADVGLKAKKVPVKKRQVGVAAKPVKKKLKDVPRRELKFA